MSALNSFRRTDLHEAAIADDAARIGGLLGAGADPNVQDKNGWSPLHFAAQTNSAVVAASLLKAGARHDLKDSFGNTPLWRATMSSRGNGAVIALLLQAGANPHEANSSGVSPYKLAQTIGNFNVAQFYSGVPEVQLVVQRDGAR